MRFSPDFIEKVRDANNIVEIISQFTELKGSGGRLMGRCPYPDHSDKSPSFSVDEHRQLFHCFGCKKGGDVFNFLETYNGVSFPEAIEHLARRASIPLPEPENGGPQRQARASQDAKELFYKLNREAAVFWHRQLKALPTDHPALVYLERRGLSRELIDVFRIGVSLPDWDGFVNHLESRNAPLAAAETLGLIRKRKTGQGYFDLFRERIMFPIFSPTGEVVGFGGRTFGDGTPKYLNSPETPVFSKGRTFYGLHETGKYLRSMDEAIVVEGYMDAIALYAAGLKNVVAILGTAFTAEHAKVLKRYTSNVKMLLDGDEAGMSAADRSLPILLEAGIAAKGFFLPEKLDPDDFVRDKGAAALRAELDRAPELFSLIVAREMRGYAGSPSEKVRIIELLAPVFKVIKSSGLLELYFHELAQRLDVDFAWVRKTASDAVRATVSAAAPRERRAPAPTLVPTPGPPPLEEGDTGFPLEDLTAKAPEFVSLKGAPRDEAFVLSLALHNETLLRAVRDGGVVPALSHDGVRRMLELAFERYGQMPKEFARLAASLSAVTDQPQVLSSSLEVVEALRTSRSGGESDIGDEQDGSSGATEEALLKVLGDYMNAIRRRHLKNQAKQLANQIRNSSSAEALPGKLEQIMNLVRNRHSLDRET